MACLQRGTPATGAVRPRRRDHLAAFFSLSRSRSPSRSRRPAAASDAATTLVADAANQAVQVPLSGGARGPQGPSRPTENHVGHGANEAQTAAEEALVTTENAPQATASEIPDLHDETLDIPTSAYETALSSFDRDQRAKLAEHETLRSLFEQLNKSDHDHEGKSLLRRGLSAVKPYLERLNATIDFASPFASIEPAVGTAFGLVKGTTSIAIAICGRFDDMTKDIATFLERIPAIDRCSHVVRDERLPEVYKALISVYTDLLRFYLKTIVLFKESHFVLHVALDILKPAVADIVSSFNTHADTLSKLLEAENFASIQEIKDEQVETLIRDTLDRNRDHEWSYQNELKRRADSACSWITSDDSFSYWLLNVGDSNLLALLGDMGSGKTMTTAFVADTLAQRGRPLCAYYCKVDQESATLGNIYRSILLQFLRRRPHLKWRFWEWYNETSPLVSGDPTQSDEKLRGLLHKIILSSKEPVFLVLDALDECKPYPRKQLLSLFRDLFTKDAHLKVFMSSRYDSEVEADMPPGVTRVELRSSRERDRAIAAYLVTEVNLPAVFHPKVVEELAARSNGSAIWLRIAVAYLAHSRIQNQKGMEMALRRLPESKGLVQLYRELFEKICGDDDLNNRTLLQSALEILAVARRPLTVEELACALRVINPDGEDPTTLSELNDLADSIDLLSLIRPFVAASDGQSRGSPRLRLIHSSLKELLLALPPSEWNGNAARAVTRRNKEERLQELEAGLLRRCIAYLLLGECEESDLLLDWKDESGEAYLLGIGNPFDNEMDAPTPTSPRSALSLPSSYTFDPSQLGFGRLFAYAASCWTDHFSDVAPELRPDVRSLAVLCQRGTRRLENWVQQWRRPNCTQRPERDLSNATDLLAVVSKFGPVASITDVLHLDPDESTVAPDSVRMAAWHLMRCGQIATLRRLVQCEKLGKPLRSYKFLYEELNDTWLWSTAAQANESGEWGNIFAFLIAHLREDLLEVGDDLLRRAASSGCLVLIQKLFEAAETDPDLHRAIVRVKVEKSLWAHQSIGMAACWGHVDIVRFLCERPELESHLKYVNHRGDTVFHQAGRLCNVDIFRILIGCWPEGMHVPDGFGDMPIYNVVFNNPGAGANVVNLVRVLIKEGGATGRFDPPGLSPLCAAVRGGSMELLRMLVVEGGADVWQVVGVDQVTRRPSLLRGMDTQEQRLQEQMLQVLCSLVPLAVSVHHLV